MIKLGWIILVWSSLIVLIFFCIFRLYTVSKTLDDIVIVLMEQVWTLQLHMINSFVAHNVAVNWSDDALSIKGPKGDLLLRRYNLIREWAKSFDGTVTEFQSQIQKRLNIIDNELRSYGLHLSHITALTLKMLADIYHGNFHSSAQATMDIVQKIRLL